MSPKPISRPDLKSPIMQRLLGLVHQGRLDAAYREAVAKEIDGFQPFAIISDVLSAASWLSRSSQNAEIRARSQAVLSALGKINAAWVENAIPRPLPEKVVPKTVLDFNALFVFIMKPSGFYHPLELDGISPDQVPRRPNIRTEMPGYHERQWDLIAGLLGSVFPEGLAGKTILEGGSADGFFTLRSCRAGADVHVVEIYSFMAARTAVFSALAGLDEQVSVYWGPVADLGNNLSGPGATGIDALLVLGLIYHFDDLIGDLKTLTAFRRPMVFEFPSVDSTADAPYDPSAHKDRQPVSLTWLQSWLDQEGFTTRVEPAWRSFNATLPEGAGICEMVLATPK